MRKFWLVTLLSLFCCGATYSNDDQPKENSGETKIQEAPVLEATLQDQINGQPVNRRERLVPLLGTSVVTEETAFPRWSAGYLEHDKQWKAIETFSPADAPTAYEVMRAQLLPVPGGELKLADWCEKEGMLDRSRAHHFGVLEKDPNNLAARQALGHVALGNHWIEREVLEKKQEQMRRNFTALRTWTPALERILDSFSSHVPKKATQALKQLDAIDTEEALPAIEIFAANVDNDLAKPLVRKMASAQSREACESLVRISLTHPSDDIRRQAAGEIKKYPPHFYIPNLLDMLADEVEVQSRFLVRADGNIVMETVLQNEMHNSENIRHVTKALNVLAKFSSQSSVSFNLVTQSDLYMWSIRRNISKYRPVSLGRQTGVDKLGSGSASASAVYVPQSVLQGAAQSVAEQARQQERAVESMNRELENQTQEICDLLRATTSENFGNDPMTWWTWWKETNERYSTGKQTDYRYAHEYEKLHVTTTRSHSSGRSYFQDLGKRTIRFSCLVPGTLIQTGTGLVAIEDVKVGDLVVSQNVETGELALKPVIMTTVRPPKSTTKIATTDGEVIDATGGHHWWVTGKGWIQTSKLQPGMLLHTATGVAEIKELVESPEEKKTHNLVVDDFHTYFVGAKRVLSYDNTDLQPSLRQIPGFGQQELVAAKKGQPKKQLTKKG